MSDAQTQNEIADEAKPAGNLGPGIFVAHGPRIYFNNTTIAEARSSTMARRIANALNQYQATQRGQ